jgi:hypothetical protein
MIVTLIVFGTLAVWAVCGLAATWLVLRRMDKGAAEAAELAYRRGYADGSKLADDLGGDLVRLVDHIDRKGPRPAC